MPYPSRPVLEALPEFQGTATVRQSAEQRERLVAFSAEQYRAGRSLRQIAELTDRSQTAIRRALRQAGIQLRDPGAPSASSDAARPS
ncbi:MAG: helix-turn-helix domain-containing protein [Phycicoccus sp.]|uniref:helix-turn-helix domain-containing protein n=1 Tax=Phycicoccus sp. TaxID=1902410 RepID=UPI00258BD2E0|nr:helix-turn-helix domain-containing protein [Phycicoccus sp.]MCO5303755.1 helix-turn-helix domain-containing protein [Phycicoccus sp.]